METVPCPLCQTTGADDYLHVADRFRLEMKTIYSLVRCRHCKLVYLNPRPIEAESGQFYESAGYIPFVSAQEAQSQFERIYIRTREWHNRWKRRHIERHRSQPGRLLDVGCGTGEFLREMARAGWQVCGCERDSKAAAYAAQHDVLDVICGDIESLGRIPGPASGSQPAVAFDVVTMWHVLEHLYAPHQALSAVRDLLAPGGLLIIAVPNLTCIDARFYRQHWVAYDAPRHLQHFSPKTLRAMVEMHKFRLLDQCMLPLDSFFNAVMSELLITARFRSSKAIAALRLLRAAGVASAAFLCGLATTHFRHPLGSSIMYCFEKSDDLNHALSPGYEGAKLKKQ